MKQHILWKGNERNPCDLCVSGRAFCRWLLFIFLPHPRLLLLPKHASSEFREGHVSIDARKRKNTDFAECKRRRQKHEVKSWNWWVGGNSCISWDQSVLPGYIASDFYSNVCTEDIEREDAQGGIWTLPAISRPEICPEPTKLVLELF